MATLSSPTRQLIEEVVCQQRSSPSFPLFCITHVTDPKYQFLFQSALSEQRTCYEKALERANASLSLHACRSNLKSDQMDCEIQPSSPSSSSSALPGEAALRSTQRPPLFIPEYFSSAHCATHPILTIASSPDRYRIIPAFGDQRRTNIPSFAFFLSLDDVERVWKDIRNTFDGSSPSRLRLVHRRIGGDRVFGPHAPHVFSSREVLQHFMEDVLLSVAQENKEKVNAIVLFMLGRLPMTECFLLTLNYIIKKMLHYVHDNLTIMISLQLESRSRKDAFIHPRNTTAMKWARPYGLKRISGVSGQFTVELHKDILKAEENAIHERPLQRFRAETMAQDNDDDFCETLKTSEYSSRNTAHDGDDESCNSLHKCSLFDNCDLLVNTMQCLEYAGTILYMMSHLLQLHRQREGEFESVAGTQSEIGRRVYEEIEHHSSTEDFTALNNNPATAPSRVGEVYYGCAFEHYLLLVSRRLVHTISSLGGWIPASSHSSNKDPTSMVQDRKNSSVENSGTKIGTLQLVLASPVYTYLLDMMQMWGSELCWRESAREEWMTLRQQLLKLQQAH